MSQPVEDELVLGDRLTADLAQTSMAFDTKEQTVKRTLISIGLVLAITPPTWAGDTASTDTIAEFVQQLDPRVGAADADTLKAELGQEIRRRRREINEQDVQAWRKVKSLADWVEFKRGRIESLRRSLGAFPGPPEDLNVRVTRTLKGDGYRIECLVFESRPGLRVTANLYRPELPRDSMPGILICHSHHNPKTQGELQDMGMNWARAGCLVLVMDQLGHGERRQHPFRTDEDYVGEFRRSRQDYYFRYNVGMQLHLLGDSLMGWMVWDLRRGIDLLFQQPGIDPNRIVLLGAVAGGGDPCAVTAALDKRIKAAVPFNFGGPQPENVFPLPTDAELSFNYLGGGSWESTRNLRVAGEHGFLPWVIVGSIAPRRLIYAHEFSWDREHDPVWSRLKILYQRYGVPDHLASVAGYGRVQLSSREASHCNNIGAYHRKQIYPLLEKWFGIAPPEPEYRDRREARELYCVEGVPAAADLRLTPVVELANDIAQRRISRFRTERDKLSAAQQRKRLRQRWSELLGVDPHRDLEMAELPPAPAQPVRVHKIVRSAGRLTVPLILLLPRRSAEHGCPCVVAVAQGGKASFLKHRARQIAELLSAGIAVCLPDLPGSGQTSPGTDRGHRSRATGISSGRLMLGGTIVGDRLSDLLATIKWVRQLNSIDADRIAVWGDSFAPVNAATRNIVVPLRAGDEPDQAEPLGATLSLLAGLFDSRLMAVVARGGLVSIRSVLDSQFVYVPHDWIVPGALTAGDLADLAAGISPAAVRVEGLVDGTNRRVSSQQVAREWAVAQTDDTVLVTAAPSDEYTGWLQNILRKGTGSHD